MFLKIIQPFFRNNQGFKQSFSSFQQNMEKKQQQMSEQDFKKEIEFMANKPNFNLIDFKIRILDGLEKQKKGLKYRFLSGNESSLQQLESQKRILNAMYDAELQDHNLIKGDQKKQIAIVFIQNQASSQSVQEINQLLRNFQQLLETHTWLRLVKQKGELVPESQEELIYRFRRDNPNYRPFVKLRMKKPRMSRRQFRQRIKWGWRKKL